MSAARGDRKSCTHPGCRGTMQFGREPLPRTAEGTTADGERGWVCSQDAGHFQRASNLLAPGPGANNAAGTRLPSSAATAPGHAAPGE